MSSSKGRRITEETNRKQDGTTITYRREVPVTDPASLDDTQHLSSFGFDQNSCMLCSKTNEQCEGLLMQCGICKRAYYCSTKCFNADLENHQKICKRKNLGTGLAGSKRP